MLLKFIQLQKFIVLYQVVCPKRKEKCSKKIKKVFEIQSSAMTHLYSFDIVYNNIYLIVFLHKITNIHDIFNNPQYEYLRTLTSLIKK